MCLFFLNIQKLKFFKQMKKEIFLLLFILFFYSCGNNVDSVNNAVLDDSLISGTAQISFSKYEYDFGKIVEGEQVSYFFKYTNTGTADLIVTSASASCGCTVPKYDIKPIRPEILGQWK